MRLAPAVVSTLVAFGLQPSALQEGPGTSPPLGLDAYYFVPDGNPVTPAKILLGAALFSDPALSSDRRVACATCHRPEHAFSDGERLSAGAEGRRGGRHTPALINMAYSRSFFWDGRAADLEAQVLEPIINPEEMNLTLDELTARLRSDTTYVRMFADAFGEPPSPKTAAHALATFVRTRRFGNAAVDRYERGDTRALSSGARRGLTLFRGRAGCSTCHSGPNFTDQKFHNTGVSSDTSDLGRFSVTGIDKDRGAFKTPTLREIARTAPYMHDGSIATLSDVIRFYNDGGRANPHLDREIVSLGLKRTEQRDLEAFLNALTSER